MPAQVPREVVEDFARRLYRAMTDAGLSQSDLARKIWGTTTDPRGFDVAKNRDRISQWLKARSLPDRDNVKKLAAALDVKADDLLPVRPGGIDDVSPEVSMVALAGHPDMVRLVINKVMPFATAAHIIQTLSYENDEAAE